MYAVKDIKYFCTHTHTHSQVHLVSMHQDAHMQINQAVQKSTGGFTQRRAGCLLIWVSQFLNNYFEIRYLLYLNVN